MGQKDYHITKRPDGSWQYKLPGSDRASGITDTQAEAERQAKDSARRGGGGEITIHRPNGQIRDKDTIAPANDPYPPKDMKHQKKMMTYTAMISFDEFREAIELSGTFREAAAKRRALK